MSVVVGNAEIFNTRLCVVAPQLAGDIAVAYRHETECFQLQ